MREFSWTYEYARDLVKKLPITQLNALIRETQYQKAIDDYRQASYAAMIVVALVSDKKHRKTVRDIIGDPPKREGEAEKYTLEKAARKQRIELPKEE